MGKHQHRIEIILLFLVILIGIIPRLSGLSQGFAFTFDQGRDILAIEKIVTQHKLTLIGPPIGPIDGVFHGVWWYWFLTPIYWLMQGSVPLIVTVFNIFSLSAIVFIYLIGKQLFNRQTGLLGALFIAVSPHFIAYATQLWHPYVIPILLLIFLLVLVNFFQSKKGSFALGLVLGFIVEFHLGLGIFFLIGFCASLLLLRKKIPAINYPKICIGFLLPLLPRIIF